MDRWPADAVERRPVAELVPYARNARTHSPEQIAQIAASIREFGWTIPILLDEQGGLIAGHARTLAAHKLGLTTVPVMVARGWTDAQKRAYVLADNKLALNAGWDAAMLALELSDLQEAGFDMGLIGFDAEELASLLDAPTTGLTDPDAVPETPTTPTTSLGDIWLLDAHRLACGDCTDADVVGRVLDNAKPQLMVTDPPYGVMYDPGWRMRSGLGATRRLGKVENDDRADWGAAWQLFAGDVAYVWHAALHSWTVADSLVRAGFTVRAQIIWAKESLVMGQGHYHWQHEPAWYAVRSSGTGHWAGDRKQTTLWKIPSRNQDMATVHSTQKPVECMKRPIENNSSAGNTVYEPFSGSGTTIIAAEMTGRSCYAIELSERYVDVAVKRWQDFTGHTATLEGDGRPFAIVAAERAQGQAE
jgi:DNA modification methylase